MSDRDAEMLEPSAQAEAAWHAFARSIAPDDDAQARVLQRVRARVEGREARDDDDVPAEPQMRRAAAVVLVLKSSAISVGLAGGTLLSIKLIAAALQPSAPPAPPAPVAVVEAPAVVPTHAPARAPAPAPRAIAPAPVVEPPSIAPVVQRATRTTVPTTPRPEDLLQAEIELMGKVRAAVQANEHARALELLATHRTRFPAGAFAEERDAFAAIAACRSKEANGPALARAFAAAHPRSVQLAAVRAACDSIANGSMDPGARQQ